jgi:hypothetical protein
MVAEKDAGMKSDSVCCNGTVASCTFRWYTFAEETTLVTYTVHVHSYHEELATKTDMLHAFSVY